MPIPVLIPTPRIPIPINLLLCCKRTHTCVYRYTVCICMYVYMDGWMDGWMHACMWNVHVQMHSVYLYIYIYIYIYTYLYGERDERDMMYMHIPIEQCLYQKDDLERVQCPVTGSLLGFSRNKQRNPESSAYTPTHLHQWPHDDPCLRWCKVFSEIFGGAVVAYMQRPFALEITF